MSKRPATFVILLIPCVVAAGLTYGLHYLWDHQHQPKPVLAYSPSVINLGSCERGASVTAHFAIHNEGNRELIVDQFSTSCSCAGVEREQDGKPVRVESVHVGAGATAELFVRIAVNGAIGDNQFLQVFFHCNDPAHPMGQVDIAIPFVTGGIFPWPRSLVFGTLPVGKPVVQIVDLFDAGSLNRKIGLSRSLQPERFHVRVLPLSEGQRSETDQAGRVLVARLEVTAQTDRAGPLDGEIEVELVGQSRTCRFPVTGEVVSAVDCSPRTLVLPRRVVGQTVFNGEVFLQSREEVPIEIRVLSKPAWLKMDVREVSGHPEQKTVFVEGRPDSSKPMQNPTVRLSVQMKGRGEEVVVIPICVAELPP